MPSEIYQETSQFLFEAHYRIVEALLIEMPLSSPKGERKLSLPEQETLRQEASQLLLVVAQALEVQAPELVSHFFSWQQLLFQSQHRSPQTLTARVQVLLQLLPRFCSAEAYPLIRDYIQQGLPHFSRKVTPQPSILNLNSRSGQLAYHYLQALRDHDLFAARRLILDSVRQGMNFQRLCLEIFQPVQYELGRLWHLQEINTTEEHYCTEATQMILSHLYPTLANPEHNGYSILLTCVAEEEHSLGLRLLRDFFEADGWNVYYLGAKTPIPDLIRMLERCHIHVLGISVTMIWHVRHARQLIQQIRQAPHCGRIKVMVGGHVFQLIPQLWQKIGADGYAKDAQDSLTLALQLAKKL